MISPWGVFKASLCENYLESIKIAALLLSCRPGESREVPVSRVEAAITYSSEKIAPALGRQAFLLANRTEGPLLISWPVTLRDEPEEKTHNAESPVLCAGPAAENTCGACAERLSKRVIMVPELSLGRQPGSATPAPLPATFCAVGTRQRLPSLPALPPTQLHRSAPPAGRASAAVHLLAVSL